MKKVWTLHEPYKLERDHGGFGKPAEKLASDTASQDIDVKLGVKNFMMIKSFRKRVLRIMAKRASDPKGREMC